LVYAVDVNILGGIVHSSMNNTGDLVVASKATGLEVNADNIPYILLSRVENAGGSHNMKTDNSYCEIVEGFKCLGTNLTDKNYIKEEIKSRLKIENAWSHSAQDLLFFSLLSKNIKFKIHRTIILFVVLYGCETWSLTLREEQRLRCLKIGC